MDVEMIHGRSDVKAGADLCIPVSVGRSGPFVKFFQVLDCYLLSDLDFRLDFRSEGRVLLCGQRVQPVLKFFAWKKQEVN